MLKLQIISPVLAQSKYLRNWQENFYRVLIIIFSFELKADLAIKQTFDFTLRQPV